MQYVPYSAKKMARKFGDSEEGLLMTVCLVDSKAGHKETVQVTDSMKMSLAEAITLANKMNAEKGFPLCFTR